MKRMTACNFPATHAYEFHWLVFKYSSFCEALFGSGYTGCKYLKKDREAKSTQWQSRQSVSGSLHAWITGLVLLHFQLR